MSNIKMMIQGHNKKTLHNFERKNTETDKSLCNSFNFATDKSLFLQRQKPMPTQKQMPHQERNI